MTPNEGSPFDPALAEQLGRYELPPLSAGFADRVVAAALAREAPLPPLRRTRSLQVLRHGRRLALGLVVSTMLASAAAASGALEAVGINLPPVREVVAAITGNPAPPETNLAAAPVPPPARETVAATEPVPPAPEDELDTAFARADARIERRTAIRREVVDQRIDRALEQRRVAGLPVPNAEEEARLRERLAERRARQDELAAQTREQRRAALRERLAQGEPLPLAREAVAGPPLDEAPANARLRGLRERLAQRREALANDAPAPDQAPAEEN